MRVEMLGNKLLHGWTNYIAMLFQVKLRKIWGRIEEQWCIPPLFASFHIHVLYNIKYTGFHSERSVVTDLGLKKDKSTKT